MKNKVHITIIIILIFSCIFLFFSFYNLAKKNAIDQINRLQIIYAKQASRSIRTKLTGLIRHVKSMAKMKSVISLTKKGKDFFKYFYHNHRYEVNSIIRMNKKGIITFSYLYPKNIIGKNISKQTHVENVIKHKKPIMSDIFKNVEGFDMIALHVPVYKNGKFDGTLGIGINFKKIINRYLDIIKIGKGGYAILISKKGIELYCPVPGHIGQSIFDTSKNFPSIIKMAKKMIKGKAGVTTYNFNYVRDKKVINVKKHAVYMPIKFLNTYWSIIVATPEKEIISSIIYLRNRILIVLAVLLITAGLISYYGLKSFTILKEEKMRKKAEAELIKNQNALIEAQRLGKIGSWEFDVETQKAVWSKQMYEIFGITETKTEIEYEKHKKYILGYDWSVFNSAVTEAIENGTGYDIIIKITKPDGNKVSVNTRCKAQINKQGKVYKLVGTTQDITERINTQNEIKALLKSTEKRKNFYERILSKTTDAVRVTDKNDVVIYANQAMAEIAESGVEELIGNSLYKDFHKKTNQEFLPFYEQAKKTREAVKYENLNIETAAGKNCIQSGWLIPLIENDNFSGMICTVQDVSEKLKAEIELKENEKRLKLAQSLAHLGFWIWNVKEEKVIWSDEVYNIYGVTRDNYSPTISGNEKMTHPEDFKNSIEALQKAIERKEDFFYLIRIFRPSGEMRYVNLFCKLIFDDKDNFKHVFGAALDITELKNAQYNIEKYHEIVENIVSTYELDAILELIHAALNKQYNFDSFTIALIDKKNNTLKYHKLISDNLDENIIQSIKNINFSLDDKSNNAIKCINEQESIYVKDYAQLSFDNNALKKHVEKFKIKSNLVIPLSFQSKPLGILALSTFNGKKLNLSKNDIKDIERVVMRLSIAINNSLAFEEIQEQKLELEKSLEREKNANFYKTEFLQNMSHEIRTPLNAIIGFNSLMALDDNLTKDQQENLELINKSGERLMQLLMDILTISKIEQGKVTAKYETFELKKLLEEIREMFALYFKGKKIHFSFSINGIKNICTDNKRLNQILVNLVGNAIKFTSKGEISIQVKDKQSFYEFSVCDTGIGISKKLQKIIFNSFVVGETGFTKNYQGAGLGLNICKRLVSILEGDIWVKSEPDKGSCFYFTIKKEQPIQESENFEEDDNSINMEKNNKKLNIAIVDDEPSILQFVEKVIIQKTGHKIKSYLNCKKFLQNLNKDIDLILLDIRMPEISGVDCLKKIRELSFKTPVIALTAFAGQGDEERFLNTGFDDYISKPISIKEFINLINKFA